MDFQPFVIIRILGCQVMIKIESVSNNLKGSHGVTVCVIVNLTLSSSHQLRCLSLEIFLIRIFDF